MLRRNLLMLLAVIVLAAAPLLIHAGGTAEFGGSDGEAEQLITQINPDYQPWFQSIWTPPSSEIESLLFALQAALGAGLVAFYFGRRIGLAQGAKDGSADKPQLGAGLLGPGR